jgi:hypothetical protein
MSAPEEKKTAEKMWKVDPGMESILSTSLPDIEETAWKGDEEHRPDRKDE